jgi:hypothetical protein
MRTRFNIAASILAAGAIGTATLFGTGAGEPVQAAPSKPNIIFVILDDVGIDQLKIFNPDILRPPLTPNIDLIAKHGVKFTNMWAMPECSPSRAANFTGRYAIRTGVEAAILNNQMPQGFVSSFEATLPRVLAKAGYTSALIGKYHLGDYEDPAGKCAPATRGFDFFQGVIAGGPPPVDTTAGGIDPSAAQVCGYYQTKAAGACYTAPGDSVRCSIIDAGSADPGTDPARTCLQHGGIFVPNKACGVGGPTFSDFSTLNAYYVWNRTTISGARDPLSTDNSCTPAIDRRFLTAAQGEDAAAWWQQQSGPRMLTLSFNAIHTPVQKPSTEVVPDPKDAKSECSTAHPDIHIVNTMIESMDVQIGRTLAQIGLGTLAPDGRTLASLNLGNTMVVIYGDNGSLLQTVRAPFNPLRAKASVYQTGVWVPMVIAGAKVKARGRSVDEMVNAVDLYQLFGDIASVDVKSVVPPSHALDSQPMLPYLTDPAAPAIRTTNFTQQGIGTYNPDPAQRSYPCRIDFANYCDETLFYNESLCVNDGGGTWYGPGTSQKSGVLTSCCAVAKYVNEPSQLIAPVRQYAIRNGIYKLVQIDRVDCQYSKPITSSEPPPPFPWAEYYTVKSKELYNLTPTKLNPKGLDNAADDLVAQNCAPDIPDDTNPATCLKGADRTNYIALNKELQATINSAKAQDACQKLGDGNLDMRVNQQDVQGWQAFNGKGPSRYDINLDGQTDEKDLAIIQANQGKDCLGLCKRADLNRDGKVTSADMALLKSQTGVCTDAIFCGGDLNGDGKVDSVDVQLMLNAEKTCK